MHVHRSIVTLQAFSLVMISNMQLHVLVQYIVIELLDWLLVRVWAPGCVATHNALGVTDHTGNTL